MSKSGNTTTLAMELRRLFDQEFARAPAMSPPPAEQLLAIQIADQPYALRLTEVRALLAGERITLLPASIPGFLGLLGHRGDVLPAYSLRELLGFSRGPLPRWFVIASHESPIALGFDTYEGSRTQQKDRLHPVPQELESRAHVEFFTGETGDKPRAILNLVSLISAIEKQCRQSFADTKKE